MKAAPLILLCAFALVLFTPDGPGVSDNPGQADTHVDAGVVVPGGEIGPVERAVMLGLAEQLSGESAVYASATQGIRDGQASSLADVNRAVKTAVAKARDDAFAAHLAPLLESINGTSWDAEKAAGGFQSVSDIKREIADRIRKALGEPTG